jgi:endonuclease YncB( thermonuclease family)
MYQEWVKVNFTTQRNASLLNISSRSKCVYVIAGIVLWCRKQGSPDPIRLCSVAHNLISSSPYIDLGVSHFGVESTQRTTGITGSKSIIIYLFIANKKHNKLKLLFCKAGV